MNKLLNFIYYSKWVNCNHDWHHKGYYDFKCKNCGAAR